MKTANRAWSALGTPTMVRVITAGMLVYAMILGALIIGYTKVQTCVTEYSDQSARRTSEIAQATNRSAAAQIAVADALSRAEDVAQVRAAAAAWAQAVRDQEQLRASLPPPPPPSERC
ncbi:hypothetical protein ACIA5A_06055 [Micromonospora sp. NPDC051300]|uniref:hypothetical protein n=1 Tax=Micromonospora sp. NPDC051300 TaxID=3364286 RepID=UPI0037AA0D15